MSSTRHGIASGAIASALLLSACTPGPSMVNADVPTVDGSESFVSETDRAILSSLHYRDALPTSLSNRFADDPAARAFGHRLFFDPSLSGRLIETDNDGTTTTLGNAGEAGKVSCAGCHISTDGFVDTRSPHHQISLAALWSQRRAPTLVDVAFQPLFNWDGRRDSIWRQAIGVMESEREFNSGRLFVAEQIYRLHRAEYEAIFGAMPPLDDASHFASLTPEQTGCVQRPTSNGPVYDCRGRPGDNADYDRMAASDQALVTQVIVNSAKALEAYVRQLRCGPGRFDAWLDGQATALNESEQRGAALFVGRGDCIMCHSGSNLSDGAFHNVGLSPSVVAVAFTDTNDRGAAEGLVYAISDPLNSRGSFSDGDTGHLPTTVGTEMEGAFRTPTLRCIQTQPSFMHTGQIRTLADVVRFFDRGGDPGGGYPGVSEIHPLALSDTDLVDLTAFLSSLAGPGPGVDLRSALP